MDEKFLSLKIEDRKKNDAFRQLSLSSGVDFCSNDYLGIAKNGLIRISDDVPGNGYGSTGSRLLSGNSDLITETELRLANFHKAEAALIFNSGYDANLGLLSCVPQRGDTIIYDQLSHASIRDGIQLSLAKAYSFLHNDPDDLKKKLSLATGKKFVVTESVFSMDGDLAPLSAIAAICGAQDALLIVDEAHATGVIGVHGEGLVQHLTLQDACFARVHTFGKALGCHGAVITGSKLLRQYLINFSRPFIYTTALPASAVLAIGAAYTIFPFMLEERKRLEELTSFFCKQAAALTLIKSTTPVQAVMIPGNRFVKEVAAAMQNSGLDTRAIVYPTVPAGTERLRVVLHAFNTEAEILKLVKALLVHIQNES